MFAIIHNLKILQVLFPIVKPVRYLMPLTPYAATAPKEELAVPMRLNSYLRVSEIPADLAQLANLPHMPNLSRSTYQSQKFPKTSSFQCIDQLLLSSNLNF